VAFRNVPGDDPAYGAREAFETLLKVHDERSAAIGRDSSFSVEPWKTFHRTLCETANAYPGFAQFHEALHNGRVLATIYGFTAGDVFHDFQGGLSDALPELSLGNLVRFKMMQSLIGQGIAIFDFMRGAEDYKFEWTSEWRRDFLVLAGSPGIGSVAVRMLRLRRAVHREGRMQGLLHWLRGRD
jgi:CelD/BcsL family acetyltransferase involved in cellulose biosynthesis